MAASVMITVAMGSAALMQTNMTLCGPTRPLCSSDCKTYMVPVSTCYSPAILFPGDVQWGKWDVIDTCDGHHLNRSFFATMDGSCGGERTDGFVVPLNECVGPFGKPRPSGTFACQPIG